MWTDGTNAGRSRGLVKEGRVPVTDCFCTRSECMFGLISKWGKEADEKETPTCAICATNKTLQWRSPGVFLWACRVVFSRPDETKPDHIPLGRTQTAESNLCHKCYQRGKNFSNKMTPGERLSAYEELERSRALESPVLQSVGGAQHSARLHFLNVLAEGDLGYLQDGLKMYERARKEAELVTVSATSMTSHILEIMKNIGYSLMSPTPNMCHSAPQKQTRQMAERLRTTLCREQFPTFSTPRCTKGRSRPKPNWRSTRRTRGGVKPRRYLRKGSRKNSRRLRRRL